MKRKRLIMVLYLSLACLFQVIGQLHPQKAAELFFQKKLAEERIYTNFRFEEPIRHGNLLIFECLSPAGFVLVKETDSYLIAGYSTRNRFTRNNKIPDPALALLESISRDPVPDLNSGRQKTTFKPIGPLLRTTWSQEGYFSYYCPEDPRGPDNHTYAGCAAVAMGQIIRYFGKFNNFQVTAVSDDDNYGKLTATLGNFDWERMENTPITIDLPVSELLFGLGVLTHMDYSPNGSTTSNFLVYEAFKELEYYTAIRMVGATTSYELWEKNFHENIAEYKPIYVSGSGHSFVCDGIDQDGLFHFNLGWYGYADGYYPLNLILTINPSEAIFNLGPYSNNFPPANLSMDTLNGEMLLKWEKHRLAAVDPIAYRVYLNDSTSFETTQTEYNLSRLPPGNHELMVTAVYPQGESRWIGPIQMPVAGDPVDIRDIGLRSAIREELIRENITLTNDLPTIDQLLKIRKLEIRHPLNSLAGLENCHNIQVLTIEPDEMTGLDLGPVSLLKRLKKVEVGNVNSNSFGLLAANDRLIDISLIHCPQENFNFLKGLGNLLSLTLIDLDIPDYQVLSNLTSLKQLTLNGCNLTFAGFIQNLPDLEYLDLSRNQIQRFRLTDKVPALHVLNLSDNQVNELYFLEYIPNIQILNLARNRINKFITGVNFKYLKELNLGHNSMDSLWTGYPMPALTRLSAESNSIQSVELLKEFAPSLTYAYLSDNRIGDLWKGSLQALEYLDLSKNRLTLLNDLLSNPSLTHIDISFNQLTDLYPVYDHNNGKNIRYLDLTGNPLSVESNEVFAPCLKLEIDTLLIPDNPQTYSPGYPQPARNGAVTGQTAELSWQTDPLPENGYYQIYTGLSRDKVLDTGRATTSGFPLDIMPGQQYFWRVRTVLPDTSYLSGLFNFKTFQPFTLPFQEGFENYPPYTLFTELSGYWIRAANGTNISTDGRIDPGRRSEGKQSLKLMNASDLKLPMGHLYQSVLYISMQLLIGEGCIASVRVNDINGASLELYFKSNKRCDVLINNQLRIETPYRTSEWFPLLINLFSKGNEIWIKVGSTDIPITWIFTGNLVHAGEMEFASAAGPNWPYDGQPLFHVDDMEIRASGSVGTESIELSPDVSLFPNPANHLVTISVPEPSITPDIRLFDISGKSVRACFTGIGPGKWTLTVTDLVPGIYLVGVTTGKGSRFTKLLIGR